MRDSGWSAGELSVGEEAERGLILWGFVRRKEEKGRELGGNERKWEATERERRGFGDGSATFAGI